MDRDLKKLSRGELVELLCRLREAADELNAENGRLQARAEEAEARCAQYEQAQAEENARRNGLADRFSVVCGDLRQAHAQIPAGSFDFAVSNPPYYPPGSGRLRKEDSLSLARSELCCPLDVLCAAAARALRWGGRLYLVHKPERLADLMVFLRAARLEPKRLRFVRHSAASAVSLVLLEARLGGKPGLQIEPELVLYGPDGSESAACRRIYHRQE